MSRDSGTVDRVIAMLAHLAASDGPIQVSTAAAGLGLPQSTVHRLIGQFVKRGLLRRASGSRRYEIGIEAFRIGACLAKRTNVVELAMPSLHRIVQGVGESCALGLYRESDATMFFAAQVQSPQPLRYHVDLFRSESVLWGASGRAILAHLPVQMVEVLLEGGPVSPTGMRPPRLKQLREQLARVRDCGYSISSRGERVANASGVAVPIFGVMGRVVGCLALTIPNMRYDKRQEGRIAVLMKKEGTRLSAELGRLHSRYRRPARESPVRA